MEKSRPKAPCSYSASFWISNFSIPLWENPKTPHAHDFRIVGRVHDSHQPTIFVFGDTRILQLVQETSQIILETYYCWESQNFGNPKS